MRTQRELEAIKKGLLSRSCCHGARQLHDPRLGGKREKKLPSALPLLLQVPPTAEAAQKPAGKGGQVQKLASWDKEQAEKGRKQI